MADYPVPLFDVATFAVNDTLSVSELLSVQDIHVRPIMGNALYADFMADINASKYSELKKFAVACAERWLYHDSLSKKLLFSDFLANSAESPDVLSKSVRNAFQLAVAAKSALRQHLQSSSYVLYTAPTKRLIGGFRI